MKLKNRIIPNLLVVLLLASCSSEGDDPVPVDPDQEQLNDTLVWFDEFNDNGSPNSSKWTYDIGNNGWGNNEVQFYTDRTQNAVVRDGILSITARKENYNGSNYTSARLKTQGKYFFTYGKVEVRAKLPASAGTWPALWMLGANFPTVGWPACGEIDIMEQKGWDKTRISSALHNDSSSGNTINVREKSLPNSTSEFHVYGMNWTRDKIEFSVDGTVYYTYSPPDKNNANWPYDEAQFIIMNVAMGGTLGGDIPSDFTESVMEIDYVRVYK
ncbi:glycoside hydrolase family 16 protein [Flavobacteriaceae bacterium]|nr:glycoside hydrolase family 16 protein [Flavobacteriaceae bacterium]